MKHLTAEEVLLCHDMAIQRYGGCAGCADPDRVYALIGRIQNYKNVEDPFVLAAMCCVSVSQGHVFIDGNKRTAACCMYAILQRNGIPVKNRDGFLDIILKIAAKEMSVMDLVKHLKRLYAQ